MKLLITGNAGALARIPHGGERFGSTKFLVI
jgi:hypothetical protein